MKTYPLEPARLVDLDGDFTIAVFSRGHHEPEAFVAAAVAYLLEATRWIEPGSPVGFVAGVGVCCAGCFAAPSALQALVERINGGPEVAA